MASRSPAQYAPNASDDKVLRAVGRYHYLTSEQLTRLLFSPKSGSYTSEILTRLTRERYLERTIMPREGEWGRAKSVWSLVGKGRIYLEGMEISLLPRVSHPAGRSYSHFKHLMAVNDTLISCELFARDEDEVELAGFVHERVLHRTLQRVDVILSGKTLSTPVAADGWVDFRIGGDQTCLWLEVDRATEHVHLWLKKIQAIVEYYDAGGYNERFGTDAITVMVVAIPDAGVDPIRRRNELKRWTEQTLTHLRETRKAWKRTFNGWDETFVFTAVNPAEVTPREFFLGRHWLTPFSDEPKALLEGVG